MIFLASAALVVYVLFGYPLLLALLARLRSRPVDARPVEPSVSILLPVRDGEAWIRQKLESLAALDYPRDRIETIVVSDGSTDRTEAIAAEFPGVRLVRIPKSGKAEALNRAMAEATGEILFFTDVRQPLDARCLRHLAACFADPRVGVATGELIILDGATHEEANTGLYWKYEKWIRKRLSAVDSVLGATGCIYAMRRELARPMPAGTLLDDVYLPMLAFFRGYRIVMEERARAYDYPTALHTEFRRKVRTQAGVYQLMGQFPELLGLGNGMWLHFVSYKLGRLLLPWALIALALTSPAWALALQAVFYGAALTDRWMPERSVLKRLTSTARTFVVLMAAALCAVRIFFVRPERLWKAHA